MKTNARGVLTFVTLFAAVTASVAQQSSPASVAPTSVTKTATANYGKLPMTFEANQGQTASEVKFLSRGPGYVVFLTAGEMVFSARASLVTPPKDSPSNSQVSASQKPSNTVLQLGMVGANPNPVVAGEQPQAGKANYFIGSDSSKWQKNVATYAKVRYKNIYPGIDLVYYGNPSQMEYDFEVAPGANPQQIQFEVKGADSVSVDRSSGDLVLQTKQGALHMKSPVLYQTVNQMRLPIAGGYSMKSSTRVAFLLTGYDKSKPLVIDPVLLYSTYLGGLASDQAVGVSVDSDGSAYVAGWTQSTNFPLASQAGNAPSGTNAFVAKLDVSGSSLLYADYIGGSSDDYTLAMTLDNSNNTYVTGYTCSNDFPIVNGYQTQNIGGCPGFVSKVSADGSSLLYSTYLGGSSTAYATAIAVTALQEIYVGGWTYATDFPTLNAYQSTVLPNQNQYFGQYGFVTHFTADGSALVFSTYLAGNTNVVEDCGGGSTCWPSPYTAVSAIALDASGNAYVTGNTNTYNFPTTENAYMASQNSPNDAQIGFVSELTSAGMLSYSTYFGTTDGNYNAMSSIAVDGDGSAYVTGITYSYGTAFPVTTPNLCDPNEGGCGPAFVTKFDPTGSTLAYSTFLPLQSYAYSKSIVLDAQNNAYVLSQTFNGYMNPVNPIEAFTNQSDLLLVEIDPTGSVNLFSTYMGGNGDDFPGGVAVDASGSIYLAGYTTSSDFPVTAAALQNALGGNTDAFVAKIGTAIGPAVAISPSLVQFSIRAVGSVSQPNTSLLRNMGSGALTIASITISGDFTETDTCGTNVPSAGNCTFTVTFSPTEPGPRFGSILIQDDGAGSPHFINLVGDGSTAIATLSATTLTFPSLQLNVASAPQSLTLTNNGNATLNLDTIGITGDYAQTNTCPLAIGVGSVCTFQIIFTPTAGGARNGALTLTDNAPDGPQTINLTGSGYVTTAIVSSAGLTFANQSVGSTSVAQIVTITNTGANTMTVSGATASGDFAETTNCSSVAPTQSCTLSVTFTPTTSGARVGTLTINDDAQGNPHVVTLSGVGIASAANFSPTSLTFPSQSVGSTSVSQSITLTNSGTGQLTVTGVQSAGDFAETNNCGTVAANGGTCLMQVTFTPTSTGTRTGTLVVTDSAPNSPQTILLSGGAGAPVNTLSASSLTFAAQQVGKSSVAQAVTLTNSGNANMVIASVTAAGDFSETNNCPATIAPAAICTINVTFAPAVGGSRIGSLIVSDNSQGGSAFLSLSGTGSDFGLTAGGSTSATVKAGSKATYRLTFEGIGGPFESAVSLTCNGGPSLSTCSISPTTIPAGSNSTAVTITVTTTAAVTALAMPNGRHTSSMLAAWIFPAPCFLMFGLISLGSKKRQHNWRFMVLALVIGLSLFAIGCGGGTTKIPVQTTQPGTATGAYSLLVEGTSGSLIHTTQLTLTVQ